MPFPAYTISTDVGGALSEGQLHEEILAAGPYDSNFLGVTASPDEDSLTTLFDGPISAGNETTVDGVLAAHDHTLDMSKAAKKDAINSKTRSLISQGFEYPAASGTFYSLSRNAQMSINTANGNRSDLNYPVKWDSKDDMSDISFANASALHAFGVASAETIVGHRESGRALKATVRVATTVAQVDAVVDNR